MSLQNERLKAGLSQSKLAAISGISIKTIQKYEIGYRSIDSANLDTLCTLCNAIGCTIYDILESDDLKRQLEKVT